MKIDNQEHLRHAWLVHDYAEGFRLEDVWRFPVQASADCGFSFEQIESQVFRPAFRSFARRGISGKLFALRWMLGRLFRWDTKAATTCPPEISVRVRFAVPHGLPAEDESQRRDLMTGFQVVYRVENEYLTEAYNKTVHALLHLGWVPLEGGGHTVQMAVYVKPRGWLGAFYMALIKPFRLLIVYPSMMRRVAAQWRLLQKTGAA